MTKARTHAHSHVHVKLLLKDGLLWLPVAVGGAKTDHARPSRDFGESGLAAKTQLYNSSAAELIAMIKLSKQVVGFTKLKVHLLTLWIRLLSAHMCQLDVFTHFASHFSSFASFHMYLFT